MSATASSVRWGRISRRRALILVACQALTVVVCIAFYRFGGLRFDSLPPREKPNAAVAPIETRGWRIDGLISVFERYGRPGGADDPRGITPFVIRGGRVLAPQGVRNPVSLGADGKTRLVIGNSAPREMWVARLIADGVAAANERGEGALFEDLPILFRTDDADSCTGLTPEGAPVFGYAGPRRPVPKDCDAVIAFPSYGAARLELTTMLTGGIDRQLARYNYMFPWESKVKQAVWRGSPTGPSWLPLDLLPRQLVVAEGLRHPDLIDAAFISWVAGYLKDRLNLLGSRTRLATFIPKKQQNQYRAIIDVDGNSWSDRLLSILCLNSVVIKVMPNHTNYFFHELRPWVHYVPVKTDLSDLVDQARFVADDRNAAQLQAIVANAQGWCRTKLGGGQLAQDAYGILKEYVKSLDRVDPQWRQKWKANKMAHDLPGLFMEEWSSISYIPQAALDLLIYFALDLVDIRMCAYIIVAAGTCFALFRLFRS